MSNYFALQRHIRGIRCFCSLGFFSCLVLSCLLIATILPIANISNNTEAIIGTSTPSVITFTNIKPLASVSVHVNSSAGTFATSSDGSGNNGNSNVDERAKFSISTNNYTGYTVNIKTDGSSSTLTNGAHNIASINSSTTLSTFGGTGSAAQSLNNKWGYIPNVYNAVDNSGGNVDTYYPVPNTVGDCLRTTSVANSSNGIDNADEYTMGLGIRVNYATPSGTYVNTAFILEYVANPIAYSVSFVANDGETVKNLPSTVSGSTVQPSIVLPNTIPTRTNYTFSAWCLGTVSNDGTVCDGTQYSAGGSFGIDQTISNSNVILHPIWTYGPYMVRVNFVANTGVSSVVFEAAGHTTRTVSASGSRVALDYDTTYTVTMNFNEGYIFDRWILNSTNYGTLGSTSTNPTTFTTNTSSASAIITARGKAGPRIITYKANGGIGDDYTQEIAANASDYLDGNNFTNANKYFKGWSTVSGSNNTVEYRAGQQITPASSMTLYAVWGSSTSNSLYNIIASLNYGRTLDNTNSNTGVNYTGLSGNAGIQASITKDNSGVFSYDASVFGASSDAANTSTVYLYRGILDNDRSGSSGDASYGSNGNSGNYPNYVKLGDICWRIVRTTGSGGVKMIYNGLYSSGTTTNSCANAQDNAQVAGQAFNTSYSSIVYAGYTYNDSYVSYSSVDGVNVDIVLGSNSSPDLNNARSAIKTYIEDTWYSSISAYTNVLERSAGYCNDRSAYTDKAGSSSVINVSKMGTIYFGAYSRNFDSAKVPSLNCPRNIVDLYRYVANSTGVSNELKYPVALLTADEASFAGSGSSTASNGSAYSANSFLRSGSSFWLLSPFYRSSTGEPLGINLTSSGQMNFGAYPKVNSSLGVRPVVSLAPGTTVTSGSGTATEPWVVSAP